MGLLSEELSTSEEGEKQPSLEEFRRIVCEESGAGSQERCLSGCCGDGMDS